MREKLQASRCVLPECECGRGILQSDRDYRTLDEIARGIAQEIYFGDPDDESVNRHEWWKESCPTITAEDVRKQLNEGVFDRCFDRWMVRDGLENQLLLFVAVSMRFGARIPEKERKIVYKLYKEHLESDMQKEEFRWALKYYRDGDPWHFESRFTMDSIVGKIIYYAQDL